MNRKRHEVNNVRISDEEYGRLQNKYDLLRNEVSPVNKATATASILNIPSVSSTFFFMTDVTVSIGNPTMDITDQCNVHNKQFQSILPQNLL